MIHVACNDLSAPDGGGADSLSLSDEMMYVCRSFGLGKDQIHHSPPDGLPVILLQSSDGRYVQGEDSLVDFVHPDDCVYLLGGSNEQLRLSRPVDAIIYIPNTPTWSMFASQAAAIVLYDRFVKRGSFG
jgi:hypothetical protein